MLRPLILVLLALASPLTAAVAQKVTAHSGVAGHQAHPEWSDLALAAFAFGAVWFVRRALRARFRNRDEG